MTALYTFILNVSITFLKFRLNVLLRYGIVQEKGGDYVTVGENIQKIRKDMGLTQKELAERPAGKDPGSRRGGRGNHAGAVQRQACQPQDGRKSS